MRAYVISKERHWEWPETIAWIGGGKGLMLDACGGGARLRRRLPRGDVNRQLLSALQECLGYHAFDAAVEELIQRLERGHLIAVDLDGVGIKPNVWGSLTPDTLLADPRECRFESKAIMRLWPERRRKAKGGRRPGSGGFSDADEDLIKQMETLVGEGCAPWRAAELLAENAAGPGTLQSKQHRLYRRFKASCGL